MEQSNEHIELRSEEVQEILGHIPSRIIRYGITSMLSIIILLLAGSFFFKYPDILIASVEVVSENPPASIVAKTSGNLTQIFIADSQRVAQSELLAVIKNPANTAHVEWLKNTMAEFKLDDDFQFIDWLSQLPDSLNLGEIQSAYGAFLTAGIAYKQFAEMGYYPQKIASLKQKQIELQKYAALMQLQVSIKQQDFQLKENQFLRDSGLYAKDVISLSDFETSRAVLLQNSLSLENSRSVVVNTRIQLNELEQQITDFALEQVKQKQNHTNSLSELFQNLESRIAWWFDTYMMVAPMEGVVAFNQIWSKNQYVQAGNEVFIVLPLEHTSIIGRITLPAKGAGKVKPNQEVNLKFENFPSQEFGMITAHVSSISMVPTEQSYIVEVQLPDTLISNYGYLLPFTQKMQGTAEIITEDLPLIMRLFNPLKSIMKEHWSNEPIRKISKKENGNQHDATEKKMPPNKNSIQDNQKLDSLNQNDVSPKKENVEQKHEPVYHIIAGSFIDEVKAQTELQKYKSRGFLCAILFSNERYRLSIFNTKSKSIALKKLSLIRKDENNAGIWLLLL